jgi:glutathione synthase
MAKKLKVAVQMDHVATINPRGDSTFAMMLEAQSRGHELLHYTPDTLALRGKVVSALAQPIKVFDKPKGEHFELGEAARVDLSTQDVIHMRQDPPFDMNYITLTHLLEKHRAQGTGGEPAGGGAQCARKNPRHRFPRADAADPGDARPQHDP